MKLFSKKKKGVEKLISRCKNYKSYVAVNHKLGNDAMENYWRTQYVTCKIILEEDFGINVNEL